MVFSVAAVYVGSNNDATNDYGRVINYGDSWVVEDYNGQRLVFSSSPDTVNETAGFFIINLNQYSNKPLYIDSESSVIYESLYYNLAPFAQRVQQACYDNCENSTLVQKGCLDNMIIFNPGEKNKISQNQSCIMIDGDIRAVDAFMYKLFGLV